MRKDLGSNLAMDSDRICKYLLCVSVIILQVCFVYSFTVPKHKWMGHVLRHDGLLNDVLEGRMLGKRTRGRKRQLIRKEELH